MGAGSAQTRRRADLAAAIRALDAWGTAREWCGTDPYDGLNAQRLGLLKRTVIGRRLLTQVVKRSPLDLRRPLHVPPGRSAASLAHVLAAYARTKTLDSSERRAKMAAMVSLLDASRCRGYEDACWGYHFDVQTRAFFYPVGEPNTIATAFVGLALLDAHSAGGDPHAFQLAASAAAYFLDHVPQTDADEGGAYFGYLTGDRTPIHNANMLACALLARVGAATGDRRTLEAAQRGVTYTAARQRLDGSWPYAETPNLRWIDNFHTGYVLEALMTCGAVGVEPGDAVVEKGLAFYRERLFRDDGTPRYSTTSLYPLDAQCVAQGIQTFALAARYGTDADFAWTIYDFAMRHMRLPDGRFLFQRRRYWTNRAAHVRWVAAPMLLALTHLESDFEPSSS
jgi:hypothetical protein